MKKPPKPPTKFAPGDVAVDLNPFPGEPYRLLTVEQVVQDWVGGEWREYIKYRNGAGNADLFRKVKSADPSGRPAP